LEIIEIVGFGLVVNAVYGTYEMCNVVDLSLLSFVLLATLNKV